MLSVAFLGRGRSRLAVVVDTTVVTVTTVPTTLSGSAGDTPTLLALAKNAAGTTLTGKTFTAVSSNTGVATVSVTGSTVTVTFVAGGSCTVTVTCETVHATAVTVTVSGASGIDALIQSLIDGDYDNGYADFFEGEFPHPGTDTLLATTRLATPAAPLGNLVSNTDIVLDVVTNTPLILADSDYTHAKYFRLTKSNHTSGALFGSIGLVSDDYDPDLIVSSMDWAGGGTLSLLGALHARAVADTFDHLAVPVSTGTPTEATAYTATAQAKTAANADLHRIGITLTPSLTTVSGSGGGSIAEASVVTNRYGLSETMNVTAGAYPTTETVHVTDGTQTGDSSNVVVQAAPAFALVASVSEHSTGQFTGATTAAVDMRGAKVITIATSSYSGPPTVSDSEGNTWTVRARDTNNWATLFDCVTPIVSATQTFTVTDGQYTALAVAGFSDAATPVPDATSAADGTGGIQPGSVTPAADHALLVTAVRSDAALGTLAINSSFTIVESVDLIAGQAIPVALAYRIQATAAAINPAWSGVSGNTAAAIATYTVS